MDFDKLLSGYRSKACIMSVDILPDDRYGNIRIVAGNKAHCDDMMATMHKEFIPGSPYAEYFPENKNFEDFCYRSAVLGQPLHTYVSLPFMNLWLNMFLLPLDSDKENTGYCLYSYEVTPKADAEQRASLSADTSSAVLKTCIKLRGSGNVKDTLNEVIGDIRNICESDHCCILLVDKENHKCTTFGESINPDTKVLPMEDFIDDSFYDITQTWDATIGGSTCVIVKNQQDRDWLETINPVWYKSLKESGVNNIVLFPLIYNDSTLGYMWSLNFNEETTVKIKETLELTTFFVASEIANHFLMERLRTLSSIDMLTGIMNRNIMNNRVDRVIAGKDILESPFAIIFADMNGLKRLNDTRGHQAGDTLLRDAAELLSEVFYDAEVYRVGGDEFMVIACKMEPATVEKRVAELIEKASKTDTNRFAVGVSLSCDEPDILKAMRAADRKMYEDKKRYYENNPDLIYRT